ncbi:MAG: nicotinate phosphoribosyltransferase [Bacteroidota bacterium]
MIPTSHLSHIYRASWGNLTDFYQLTMAYGYWKQQRHEQLATFHLYFRRHPFGGTYTVAAGLALVADYLQNFGFSAAEVQYLGSLKGADGKRLFSETFLHYLQRLKFTGDVYAVPEGTVMQPHMPLIRVEAPLLQAQLIETALLNLVNFSSLIATKAARIRQVAGTDKVLEFGLRRAQGIDGALMASRAAYIGGVDATSNVWAGQYLGIPVKGTHAHSWVMVFVDELQAFAEYAEALPNNCIFLVDTYDTIEGVKKAIQMGQQLRAKGHRLLGIRLDSGDLAQLSIAARELLDAAGFEDAAIVASNDLDEYRVQALKEAGAQITTWGIGTRLITGKDEPALGGVYKLSALQQADGSWSPRIKLSEQAIKTSNPGRQQVRRFVNAQGYWLADVLYDLDLLPKDKITLEAYGAATPTSISLPIAANGNDLLEPIILAGELRYAFPTLAEVRTFRASQIRAFEARGNKPYIYGLETQLAQTKAALLAQYNVE